MSFDQRVFKKANTFGIFEQFVTDYQNKSILDFGGNHGNLIKSSDGKILEENYTCLDISKEGLKFLPSGVKSIHWDRYHSTYNPDGYKDERFPKLGKYDLVFANSVFTHLPPNEMIYCLKNLCEISNRIYFTYVDNKNTHFFERFKKFNLYYPMNISDEEINSFKNYEISYIVNHDTVIRDLPENFSDIWVIIETNYLISFIKKNISKNLDIIVGKTSWFDTIEINIKQ